MGVPNLKRCLKMPPQSIVIALYDCSSTLDGFVDVSTSTVIKVVFTSHFENGKQLREDVDWFSISHHAMLFLGMGCLIYLIYIMTL